MPRVVIADDHPLLLDGVAALLAGSEFKVVARCHDGREARKAIVEHEPDIAILDVRMPHLSGLDLLRDARALAWRTRIVLLTAELEPEPILEAIRFKVDGVVLKGASADVLMTCIRKVWAGGRWLDRDAMDGIVSALAVDGVQGMTAALTAREADVARLVAQGRRNKEIARDLSISEGTVKMHLHNLYEKLSISSRTELAILSRERGWV